MEKCFAFNSINDDRKYKAQDFAAYFASFIGNGIFPNPATNLQVIDNNNMNVVVKSGMAWINGYYYQNTEDFIFKIDVADSLLSRIDRIVLRLDFSKRFINLILKKGTFSSEPKAPELTRNADMYELALSDIKIKPGIITISQSDITDLRLNKELCGIVHGTVDQVDTTQIFNQFESWYSQTKEAYDKDIAIWTKEKKQAFEKWYSENINKFLDQWNNWFNPNTTKWEKDFNSWFDTLKDKLDGNLAAKLTKDVEQLKKDIKNIDIPVKSVNGEIGEVELKASDIKTKNGKTIEIQLAENAKKIGNINDNALPTELKGKSLTQQTKQLFQYASDGKNKIANAVTGKGVDASSTDTFDILANKINSIKIGDYSKGDLVPISSCEPYYTVEPTNTLNAVQAGEIDKYGSLICCYNDSIIFLNSTNRTLSMMDKFNKVIKEINIENFCGVSNYKGMGVLYSEVDNEIFITWQTQSNTHYFIEISVDLSRMIKKIILEFKEWPNIRYPCKDSEGNIYAYIYNGIVKFGPTGSKISRSSYETVSGVVYHKGYIYVIGRYGLYKYTTDLVSPIDFKSL